MTDRELARRRMHELLPKACPPHARACRTREEPDPACRACEPTDEALDAMAELRRLGAIYAAEREAVARRIGPTLTGRVWPGLARMWRAA